MAEVHVSMSPPHPGTFIREEILEPLDLSITRAADVLGVRRLALTDDDVLVLEQRALEQLERLQRRAVG